MALRTTLSGSSPPPASGPDVLNEYAERIGTLFDASCLPLTAVGGTADAVTATLDPPLATAGVFVDGMKFTITWGATNTAGVTLAINGGAALPVLDAAGNALIPGAIKAGLRSQIEYVGGSFRILSSQGGAGGGSESYYWAFTANGTWTKPLGLDDDRMVTIEAWGGGGAGGVGSGARGGGGGGGYSMRRVRAGDLPSSVAVTVGAGGLPGGSSSGNSTFGSILTAFGGANGANSAVNGGAGGGELERGSGSTGGKIGGGGAMADAATTWGGAGGANADPNAAGKAGGGSVHGGGGGGGDGSTVGAGGRSLYGGDGGAAGVAGSAPGGGGGSKAAGARGEVRISI